MWVTASRYRKPSPSTVYIHVAIALLLRYWSNGQASMKTW
jgi:hypothetical protein